MIDKLLKKKLVLAVYLLAALFVLGVSPHKAHAINSTTISNLEPIVSSANTDPGNSGYTPWMAVGVGAYNGPYSQAKAYTTQDSTLTITQAPCVMQDVGSPHTEYWVFSMYTDPNGVKEDFGSLVADSGIKGPTTCGQSFNLPLNNGTPSKLKGHGGWSTFYVMAYMWDPISGPDTERSFRMGVNNGGLVGLTRAEGCGVNHNPCGPSDPDAYSGIYSRNLQTGVGVQSEMWDYAVQFAPRCGESTTGASVTLYDMDQGVYSPQNLGAAIQRDDRTTSGYTWNTIAQTNSFTSGSGNFDTIPFNAGGSSADQFRERLILSGVNWRNTIQLWLPYDQFDARTSVGQSCSPPPADAYCTSAHSPTAPLSGQAVQMTVNLHNSSASGGPTFNSNWQVRQVSPGGQVVAVSPNLAPGANEPLGPFNINARTTTTQTSVDFTYQLFDPNGTAIGSPCTNTVTWKAKPTAGTAACTPTPGNNGTYQVGQSATMIVTLANNTGNSIPGTVQMRQVSPGGQAKTLGSALADGSSVDFPAYNISARSAPTTVTFTYTLFTGPNAGDPAFSPSITCQANITWTSCTSNCGGGLPPSFAVNCSETHVYNLTSTATTTKTTSGATYQTYQPPPWPTPPAPAGSPFLPGVKTYSYTPTITTTSTAKTIPLHFHFSGSDGSSNDAYFDQSRGNAIPNPSSDARFDTFNDFGFLWPHISYTVTLEAQTSGDVGTGENGPYGYNLQLGSQNLNNDCLDAACGSPSTVDAEPGQTKAMSYGVYIYNHTNKTFSANDGNGYHFSAGSDGGIVNISGINASPDLQPGNPSTTNVGFSARIDYTGGFWITMEFKGGAIGLPSLQVPCPPGSATPATRAYFEVRGSDISTGGGFSNPNSVCATTAPGYVSPATGYSSTSGRYDYAGGVRAYANPNAGRGSAAQYGLLSLGLTIGSPNGPIGFFSGHNEVFANTGVPNAPNGGNLGGYLSPSGPTSAHCVDDFFTKTRIKDTTPTPFSGNNITGLASGQYEYNGPMTLTSFGCGTPSIGVGKQITLYVDGDVTIDNNICYAKQWDPTNRANVPYFALIVHGNITLTSGVSQLDGLYVAQPSSDTDGIFNTCDTFCAGQLIVNGAVIAQQVSLNRAHGTLGPLDADVNNLTTNPAEIFNYVPSMIIGTPNFNPLYNSLEALFSLPPVF
jgi:hypothetical protein